MPRHTHPGLPLLIAAVCAIPAPRPLAAAAQFRPIELAFTAASEHADPFNPANSNLTIRWTHESGRSLATRGFWDGARTWRARFQPELPGHWAWASESDDDGLRGRTGEITAGPPDPDAPPQQRHGGILRVSSDRTHLTYADGTPFFWLADTWWGMPCHNGTPEQMDLMIRKRQSQGFSLAQIHGHRNLDAPDGPDIFQLMEAGGEPALAYWRKTDAYYRLAEKRGWHLCVGFYGYSSDGKYSPETHHRLWSYFLARYGAFPVTMLITQEYNQPWESKGPDGKTIYDPARTHGPFFTALGRWIHERDPWLRAMTAHSAVRSRDRFDAWSEPWYGFALLQNGHFTRPDPRHYRDVCDRVPRKPVIEGEMNYEGFARTNAPPFVVDATAIRVSAYSAIQSGCAGFSYGAQGLYAHITNPRLPGPTAKWGPVLTWEQALDLEGASHLSHFAALHRSLPWWRMRHLPKAVDGADAALAKACDDRLCLVYFPPDSNPSPSAPRLSGFNRRGIALTATWFDPRAGRRETAAPPEWEDAALRLPKRPDARDWVLILERRP